MAAIIEDKETRGNRITIIINKTSSRSMSSHRQQKNQKSSNNKLTNNNKDIMVENKKVDEIIINRIEINSLIIRMNNDINNPRVIRWELQICLIINSDQNLRKTTPNKVLYHNLNHSNISAPIHSKKCS